MKCYRHNTSEAVGICKACSKGVCAQCATEVDGSLACKETCSEEVFALNNQIRRARITMNTQKNYRMYMPTFFLVFGGVMAATPFYRYGEIDIRALPGVIFIIFGIALMLINKKWARDIESKI